MNKNEELDALALRIKECANICGGIGKLSLTSGVPRRTIDYYISEGTEPKWSNLVLIANAAGVNHEWLMVGTGPKLRGDYQSGVDCVKEEEPAPYAADIADEYALIPGYSIQVSAGPGALAGSEDVSRKLAFRRKWLNYKGLHEKDLVVVFAKGDSMEPTISDNNTIMVDTSDRSPQDGRMYVIRVDGHLVVKRTSLVPGQGVLLISDNKDYPPNLVKFDGNMPDLEVIGRVVWVGKDY
ncbi:S24 family peptidase [Oceanobacter kriegii]|uniref:S24 family peptidase n=1 Tax=Oceanobacter kriegii TaxID=64972 RepID=UPI000A05E7A9|nr:helix-turn-helix transcriptional regulator [Oceanobacter kriegii]